MVIGTDSLALLATYSGPPANHLEEVMRQLAVLDRHRQQVLARS